MGPNQDVPHDYFHVDAKPESVRLRQNILQKCRLDLYHFLDHEHGQVAIYDAVNPLARGRQQLADEFAKHDVQVIVSVFLGNPVAESSRQYSSNHTSQTSPLLKKMSVA